MVYGSVSTGLALLNSDIDIAVCGVRLECKEECLESLGGSLGDGGLATEVKVIHSATVPVIKTVIDLGKINTDWKGRTNKVDITFEDFYSIEHSIHYGVLFTEWVKIKKEELPHLVPLIILVKKILSNNSLNIPYYGNFKYTAIGGLSSYVLILMVSAFLRTCPGCPTIGHSFVEFLRYYAQDFDSLKMFIDRGELIVMAPGELIRTTDFLVLDPFRLGFNAAWNLTKFPDIKAVFGETFERIIDLLKRYEHGEDITGIIDMVIEKVPAI